MANTNQSISVPMRFQIEMNGSIDYLEPEDSIIEFLVTIWQWMEDEDDECPEVVVGKVFGYLVPRYGGHSVFDQMECRSDSLRSTYEELFVPANDDQEDLKTLVIEQLGDDAECWESLIVMGKIVIHPSLGAGRRKAIYRLNERLGGLSLIWGLNCNLFDHELVDLGYKPLETSNDMWAFWTGATSPFDRRDPDAFEVPEVDASVENWVDEQWPWKPGEWPHMG